MHARAEHPAVAAYVARAMWQNATYPRPPVRAAQPPQHPVGDGDRGILQLGGAGPGGLLQGVAQEYLFRLHPQHDRNRPPVVEVKVQQQVPQGLAHRRGIAHQLAQRAQIPQGELCARQQADIVTPAPARAGGQQPDRGP